MVKYQPGLEAITEDEFERKCGPPPWEIVSAVLGEIGLPFTVAAPAMDVKTPCEFILVSQSASSSYIVRYDDLSSGEKAMLSIVSALFTPDERLINVKLPRLLLLDEMDSPLHPEMLQRWLKALRSGIVDRLGINVILTTHSPTTVALADEDALYQMVNRVPQKITKQNAINDLTFGVPTLSVDYDSRTQVFCESDTDASIYETIFACSKAGAAIKRNLNFIGTGIRVKSTRINAEEIHGGEAVVRELTSKLSKCGVNNVKGIVDWDGCAVPTDDVFVLASDTHYAIENVILDPLLVGLLCIMDRIPIVNISLTVRDIPDLEVSEMQGIVDMVTALIAPDGVTSDSILVGYASGKQVKVERSIAEMNGHKLESTYRDKIPKLRKYKQQRGELCKRVAEDVIRTFPEFCPAPIIAMFAALSGDGIAT